MTFCYSPWSNIDISPQGDLTPCCKFQMSKYDESFNVQTQTLSEYYSSAFLAEIKQEFAQGQWPRGCERCRIEEENNIASKRQLDYERWQQHYQQYDIDSGKCITASIAFGNTCNLKCITCSPYSSSKWHQEHLKIYNVNINPVKFYRSDFVEKFEFDKQTKASGKDLTEAQGKASAFQSQMVSASNAVKGLEAAGFDPTSFKSQTAVRLAGGTANPLVPVTAQQYKQAQDQWSEAYLRFKTGAAATEPEVLRNNRTFFPVFGDKPDQIAQKALAREQAERDIGIAAGRGANLGAQPTAPIAKPENKPSAIPSQSAIDAELKRRGLR